MYEENFERFRKKHENPYEMCIIVSKRARQITNGSRPKVEKDSRKPVTVAMEEYLGDMIKIDKKKSTG